MIRALFLGLLLPQQDHRIHGQRRMLQDREEHRPRPEQPPKKSEAFQVSAKLLIQHETCACRTFSRALTAQGKRVWASGAGA